MMSQNKKKKTCLQVNLFSIPAKNSSKLLVSRFFWYSSIIILLKRRKKREAKDLPSISFYV